MEAKVTVYLHPATLQWASDSNKKAWHREGLLHKPSSGTRQPDGPVLLEEALWWHQVGYWRSETVSWKIRRHRDGSMEQ